MTTLIHQRVDLAQRDNHPSLVTKVASGWVVMGDVQVVRGYCLLLPDPVVPTLNDLTTDKRQQFLSDMAMVGDALLKVTGAARINYEILGNLEPALHAHLFPRYDDEPESLRQKPIWFYDWHAARSFDVNQDQLLLKEIKLAIGERLRGRTTFDDNNR